MRYIGIVTLPLLVSAVAFGRQTGLVAPLLATYFLCTFVLPYTYWLEPFQYLFDHVPILRNIRAMANTMPRDIPAVFAALLAGIGLDAFLGAGRRSLPVAGFVLAVAFGMALCAAPSFSIRHFCRCDTASLTSLLILGSRRSLWCPCYDGTNPPSGRGWSRCFFSSPSLTSPSRRRTTGKGSPGRCRSSRRHCYQIPTRFGPIEREADNWFGNYSGHTHGSGPNYVFGRVPGRLGEPRTLASCA